MGGLIRDRLKMLMKEADMERENPAWMAEAKKIVPKWFKDHVGVDAQDKLDAEELTNDFGEWAENASEEIVTLQLNDGTREKIKYLIQGLVDTWMEAKKSVNKFFYKNVVFKRHNKELVNDRELSTLYEKYDSWVGRYYMKRDSSDPNDYVTRNIDAMVEEWIKFGQDAIANDSSDSR